jgi:phage gp29-like protein
MTHILDFRGNPVNIPQLDGEQATGGISQVRQPFDPEVALGLTPKRLRSLLSRAKDGDHEDYLTLASEMEHRDAHYYSALQTRKLAVFQLNESIDAASDSAQDQNIAKEVQGFVDSAEFKLAILDILDALGKGFSVIEIIWEMSASQWMPRSYKWRNPRWFQFDTETAQELRLVDGSSDGEALDPFKYIIHRPKIVSGLSLAGGLARAAAALHVFKGYALKDWMAFAEVYGMPIRIGKYDASAKDDQIELLRRAVRDIGHDAAATIPKSMEIVFERAALSGIAGSGDFFKIISDWLNKEISKLVLGQTMTSEDGASLSQATVHNSVRIDIRNADALQLKNTINRDLIRPFVDLNFGPRLRPSEYPQYSIDIEDPEDLDLLAKALIPFINIGLPVMKSTILDKFGLPEPADGSELLGPSTEEPSPSSNEGSAKLVALKTWVETEARRSTNMRAFRAKLMERLAS